MSSTCVVCRAKVLTAVQRRVIYTCNAANRDIHDFFVKVVSPAESRIHVFANCRRCELSLSCPDIIIKNTCISRACHTLAVHSAI